MNFPRLQKDNESAKYYIGSDCVWLFLRSSPQRSSDGGMVCTSALTLDKINWIILNNVNRWYGLDWLILPGVS